MFALTEFVTEHGPMFLTGGTLLLLFGAVCQWLATKPILKQRIGEATLLAFLLWLGLALIPMPRMSLSGDVKRLRDGPRASETNMDANHQTMLDVISSKPIVEKEVAFSQSDETKDRVALLGLDLPESSAQFDGESQEAIQITPMDTGRTPMERGTSAKPVATSVWGAIYVAGFSLCCLWILIGQVGLRLTIHRANSPCESLLKIYEPLAHSTGIHNARLLVSAGTRAFTFGVLRPTIVIPAECSAEMSETDVRNLLRHELAHAGQRDAWGRLIFNFTFPLLYFHPIYWILRRGSDWAAELVADECASRESTRSTYAESMIRIARFQRARPVHFGAFSTIGAGSHFVRRIHALMSSNFSISTSLSMVSRVAFCITFPLIVTLVAGLFGLSHHQSDRVQRIRSSLEGPVTSSIRSSQQSASIFPSDTIVFFTIDAALLKNNDGHNIIQKLMQDTPPGSIWGTAQSKFKDHMLTWVERFQIDWEELMAVSTGDLSLGVVPLKDGFGRVLVLQTTGREADVDGLFQKIKNRMGPFTRSEGRTQNSFPYFTFHTPPDQQGASEPSSAEQQLRLARQVLWASRARQRLVDLALEQSGEQAIYVVWQLREENGLGDDPSSSISHAFLDENITQNIVADLARQKTRIPSHDHAARARLDAQIIYWGTFWENGKVPNDAELAKAILRSYKKQIDRQVTKLEGDEKSLLISYQNQIEKSSNEQNWKQAGILVRPGQLALTDHPQLIAKLIDSRKSLSDDADYLAIQRRCQPSLDQEKSAIHWFVRPLEALRWYELQTGASQSGMSWSTVLSSQGFDAIKGFGGSAWHGESDDSLHFVSTLYSPRAFDEAGKSNLEKGARLLTFPRAEMPPSSYVPSGLHGHLIFNWNLRQAIENVGYLIDYSAGSEGSWQRTLDGLRDDPSGPRVDVLQMMEQLASQVSIFTHGANDDGSLMWMLAVDITGDGNLVNDSIKRLVQPGTKPETRGDIKIWVSRDNDDEIARDVEFESDRKLPQAAPAKPPALVRAYAVVDKKLIVANDPDFIEAMFAPSAGRRPLADTTDYQQIQRLVNADNAERFGGQWFLRTFAGPLGVALTTEKDGWKFNGVILPGTK